MAESSTRACPQNQEQIISTMSDSAWPEEDHEQLHLPWPEELHQLPLSLAQEQHLQEQLQEDRHGPQQQQVLRTQDLQDYAQDLQQLPLAWSQKEQQKYLDVPGIRFVPSDIELIVKFLQPKLRGEQPATDYVHVCDFYSDHPKELTSKVGPSLEGNWYMFSPRNRKYKEGKRPSRSTGKIGFWKSTNKNEPVVGALGEDGTRKVIGYKGCLTYHEFDENNMPMPKPKKEGAIKTSWKMWEFVCSNSNRPFNVEEEPMRLNDWVLCKVTNKENNVTAKKFQPHNKKPKLQQEEQPPNQSIAIRQPLESGSASSSQAEEEAQQEKPDSSLPGAGGDDAEAAAADPTPLQMMPSHVPPWNYYSTGVTADGIVMDNSMRVTSDGFADGSFNFQDDVLFYH